MPVLFEAGDTVTVLVAPEPDTEMLPFGTRVGFDDDFSRSIEPALLSTSPTVTVNDTALFFFVDLSAVAEMVGASLTGSTRIATSDVSHFTGTPSSQTL